MNRAVIVTGGSRGIGKAIALKLAGLGHSVGVNYKTNEAGAAEVVQMIESQGGEALILKADMSRPEEIQNMVNDFVETYGTIFGLVNNAAIYQRRKITDLTLDDWEKTIAVNLSGPFLCAKFCLPHLQDGGRIINISSELAHKGSTQGAHYAASKSGLLGITKSLALELTPRKITVNAVAPGPTDTDIIAGDTPEKRKMREESIPLGRIAKPEDIANIVAFLLSIEAQYITGAVMDINGGLLMR